MGGGGAGGGVSKSVFQSTQIVNGRKITKKKLQADGTVHEDEEEFVEELPQQQQQQQIRYQQAGGGGGNYGGYIQDGRW